MQVKTLVEELESTQGELEWTKKELVETKAEAEKEHWSKQDSMTQSCEKSLALTVLHAHCEAERQNAQARIEETIAASQQCRDQQGRVSGTGVGEQPRCSPRPLKKPRKHQSEQQQLKESAAQPKARPQHRRLSQFLSCRQRVFPIGNPAVANSC